MQPGQLLVPPLARREALALLDHVRVQAPGQQLLGRVRRRVRQPRVPEGDRLGEQPGDPLAGVREQRPQPVHRHPGPDVRVRGRVDHRGPGREPVVLLQVDELGHRARPGRERVHPVDQRQHVPAGHPLGVDQVGLAAAADHVGDGLLGQRHPGAVLGPRGLGGGRLDDQQVDVGGGVAEALDQRAAGDHDLVRAPDQALGEPG